MEQTKINHSQQLAQYYWKELRSQLLLHKKGEWIVMKDKETYDTFKDENMDVVFGKEWSDWDESGCFCDIIGREQGTYKPLLDELSF